MGNEKAFVKLYNNSHPFVHFVLIAVTYNLMHTNALFQHHQPAAQKPDHNHVLEHSLHQLLREVHFKNVYHPMPHPVTAILGMSKRRRLAGPHGYNRAELLEMTQR